MNGTVHWDEDLRQKKGVDPGIKKRDRLKNTTGVMCGVNTANDNCTDAKERRE